MSQVRAAPVVGLGRGGGSVVRWSGEGDVWGADGGADGSVAAVGVGAAEWGEGLTSGAGLELLGAAAEEGAEEAHEAGGGGARAR
ncbi:hypothetical protein [Streptomyces sp. cf386]|uniref:hypothetical protein n=1 Tax=Streptomyces sp. cf386 TaxID=1761904 RepID=UPI000B8A00F3|nr:hypothetical protein [Streptomyces sp. cf386]